MIMLIARILIIGFLILSLSWIIGQINEENALVSVAWQGTLYEIQLVDLVIFLAILFLVLWLAIYLINVLLNAPEAFGRFSAAYKQRRGQKALAEALLAIEERNPQIAVRQAQRAELLLNKPSLTRIVNARAAQLAGDKPRAIQYYRALANSEDTEFAGLCGLLEFARKAGDEAEIIRLTSWAAELRPRDQEILQTLLAAQLRQGEWENARTTVERLGSIGALPPAVVERRVAALLTEQSREEEEAGNIEEACEYAERAFKLAPSLVSAAASAIRLLNKSGSPRKAHRVALRAWRSGPHPEIAAAYATLDNKENPTKRAKRFSRLLAAFPTHPESRMIEAELALAAENWEAALYALKGVTNISSSARGCALMAAAERGSGGDETNVRAWMARALTGSRGPVWRCDSCGEFYTKWSAVCKKCASFDTIDWVESEEVALDQTRGAAIAPLLVDKPDKKEEEQEQSDDATKPATNTEQKENAAPSAKNKPEGPNEADTRSATNEK